MAVERQDMSLILEALAARPDRRAGLAFLGSARLLFEPRRLGVDADADPFAMGSALGFERTDTIDLDEEASIHHDLHVPPPPELRERFDTVIDAGTVCWCSDPAAALRTTWALTEPGALIAHIVAVTGYFGRAYYNVHPRLFQDFYAANGGRAVAATYRTKYRAAGVRGFFLGASRLWSRTTRNDVAGAVWLRPGGFNRLSMGTAEHRPFEPNFIPNNVVGVLIFERGAAAEATMPVPG